MLWGFVAANFLLKIAIDSGFSHEQWVDVSIVIQYHKIVIMNGDNNVVFFAKGLI